MASPAGNVVRVFVTPSRSSSDPEPCIAAIENTTWPHGELLVTTGGPWELEHMPSTEHPDYVAFVSADTVVEPGWLVPLIDLLRLDSRAGAACPTALFTSRYLDVSVRSPTFRPAAHPDSPVGVRVPRVEVGGEDSTDRCQFVEGFYGEALGRGPSTGRWTDGAGILRVPVGSEVDGSTLSIELCGPLGARIEVRCGQHAETIEVEQPSHTVTMPLTGTPFEVVASAGYGRPGQVDYEPNEFLKPRSTISGAAGEALCWPSAAVVFTRSFLSYVDANDGQAALEGDVFVARQRRDSGWRYWSVPDSNVRTDPLAVADLRPRVFERPTAHIGGSIRAEPVQDAARRVHAPTAVCVLGMFASRMSVVTHALSSVGVRVSDSHTTPRSLDPSSCSAVTIADLNEQVLTSGGGSWDRPPSDLQWAFEQRRSRDVMIEALSATSPWGFCDPRLTFTVEGWLAAVPAMEFVGVFRHPAAVVQTMVLRFGRTPAQFLALWNHYNTRLLELQKRYQFGLVDADLGRGDRQSQLHRALLRVGLDLSTEVTPGPDPLPVEPDGGDRITVPSAYLDLYEKLCSASS